MFCYVMVQVVTKMGLMICTPRPAITLLATALLLTS